VLSQGHAWWHLFSGLGANWLIVGLTCELGVRVRVGALLMRCLIVDLRLAVTDPLAFEVAHYWGFVPYVRWRQQTSAK
jgi:hypothetical protein